MSCHAARVVAVLALASSSCRAPAPGAVPWVPSEAVGPSERWGQAAAYDREANRMLLFGGEWRRGQLADLWSLELEAMTFTRLETTSELAPSPRSDMANVLDEARRRWILIGGRVGFDTSQREVWSLDLETHAWVRLPDLPAPRHDIQAATDGRRAWIFGGTGMLFQSTDELWELDLDTETWRVLPTGPARPTARTSYAIAAHGGFIYVHGGHDVVRAFSDTWRYDLASASWEELRVQGGAAANAHPAVAFDVECGALVTSGGDNLDNFTVGLTEVLTLGASPRFTRLPATTLPPPRDHASLVIDSDRRLLLFGGGALGDGLETRDDLWIYPLGGCL